MPTRRPRSRTTRNRHQNRRQKPQLDADPELESGAAVSADAHRRERSRYIKSDQIKKAMAGREAEVARGVGIDWPPRGSQTHIICPYRDHDDHNPSWRITERGMAICSGNCPRGATAHSMLDVVMFKLGLDFQQAKLRVAEILGRVDLIVDPNASARSHGGATLAQLAEAKRLPLEKLRSAGMFDLGRRNETYDNPAIGIPYWDIGENQRTKARWLRIRKELTGDDRFRWRASDVEKHGKAPLYGVWQLAGEEKPNFAILCEGETDCITLWLNGIPAFGIPGSPGGWNEARHSPMLAGIKHIVVVIEPDGGGTRLLERLAASSIVPRLRVLRMPADTKDPNALWCRKPDTAAFRAAFDPLLAAAEPFDPAVHAPQRSSAPEITSPARTQADVLALINTLDPHDRGTEGQLSTITMALQGIASSRIDPVTEEVLLKQIRSLTNVSLKALREQLTALKRAIGIRPVATAATTAICRRYVFIKAINAFWDRDSRTMFSLDAVRNMHWHDMPPKDVGGGGGDDRPMWPGASPGAARGGSDEPSDPIDILIKGTLGPPCDKVDVISFVPGENEIFQEDDAVALNIWTKPELVPIEGDVIPFIDHLDYVLDSNLQLVAYVLDFMAHLVQRPAVKVKVTVLIIGDPGIGKSMIGEMLCTLVGEKNTTAVEESDLISPFNEWMDGVQLVLVNELMTVDKRAAMTRLKSYITDPWLRINRKNVPTYRYRNRANFFMCSNYEDAARIEKGDRRYLIWISRAKPRDKAYYANLRGWFDRGGAEHLLHFLVSRDLSRFDPHTAPPMTIGKQQAIDDSREPIMAYFQDAFDSGAPPFRHDLVAANHIIDYLADSRKMRVTHKQVSTFLRQIGGVPLGQKRISESSRASVWAIRNAAEWAQADEGNLAKAWRGMEAPVLTDAERRLLIWPR